MHETERVPSHITALSFSLWCVWKRVVKRGPLFCPLLKMVVHDIKELDLVILAFSTTKWHINQCEWIGIGYMRGAEDMSLARKEPLRATALRFWCTQPRALYSCSPGFFRESIFTLREHLGWDNVDDVLPLKIVGKISVNLGNLFFSPEKPPELSHPPLLPPGRDFHFEGVTWNISQ